jgi:hypothetical protein
MFLVKKKMPFGCDIYTVYDVKEKDGQVYFLIYEKERERWYYEPTYMFEPFEM